MTALQRVVPVADHDPKAIYTEEDLHRAVESTVLKDKATFDELVVDMRVRMDGEKRAMEAEYDDKLQKYSDVAEQWKQQCEAQGKDLEWWESFAEAHKEIVDAFDLEGELEAQVDAD